MEINLRPTATCTDLATLRSHIHAPYHTNCSLHKYVGAADMCVEMFKFKNCLHKTKHTQSKQSTVHLLPLLKDLHELVESVSDLRKEKQLPVITCSFITAVQSRITK